MQASPWYREVLAAVPAVYAGSAARLAGIVRVVCVEMGAAFAERGTVTPPWRSVQSLLSKWLPSKVRETVQAGCNFTYQCEGMRGDGGGTR